MQLSDFLSCSNRTGSFPGPTGSGIEVNFFGSVDLYPKRLTIDMAPKPHRLEKAIQRRVVASSVLSSAVLGFNITHRSTSPLLQRRRNEYLYKLSLETEASRIN